LHYRFAGDILSTLTALDVGDFTAAVTGGLALLRPVDAAYGIDLAIALAFIPSYLRTVRGLKKRRRVPLLAAAALVLCGAGIDAYAIRRLLAGEWWLANGYVGELAETLGVVNSHAFEYARHLYLNAGQRRQVTAQRQERVRVELDRQRPAPAEHYGKMRGRSVIMVMVESLLSFPLGLRVGEQEVTPHLNALRTKSLEFDQFYDQAWQGWTSDGWLGCGCHPGQISQSLIQQACEISTGGEGMGCRKW
jgi:phosphoglycerol transferase MdoB-like AlkP superfamily enzyme